jgi:ketosteroid isomerase-like protein
MSDQHQDFKQFMKRRENGAGTRGRGSELETLHTAASHGIAYWVGLQRAKAHRQDGGEPSSRDLRITEVFRREGSDWKLVHRHADTLLNEHRV